MLRWVTRGYGVTGAFPAVAREGGCWVGATVAASQWWVTVRPRAYTAAATATVESSPMEERELLRARAGRIHTNRVLETDLGHALGSLRRLYDKQGLSPSGRQVEKLLSKTMAEGSQESAQEAVEILVSLKETLGVQPTQDHLHLVVSTLVHTGEEATARRLLSDSERLFGFQPGPGCYLAVVRQLARRFRLADALAYIEEVREEHGVMPDTNILSYIMYQYTRNGELEPALEVFEAMTEKYGVQPDEKTLESLLHGYVDKKLHEEASALLGCMEEKYGVKPNVAHVHMTARAIARAGMVEKAEEMVYGMGEKHALIPTEHSMNMLVSAWAAVGQIDRATAVAKHFVEKGLAEESEANSAMVAAYLQRDNEKEAARILRTKPVKEKAFAAIIHRANRLKNVKAIEDWFGVMERANIEPSLFTWNQRRVATFHKYGTDAMLDVVKLMEDAGVEFDEATEISIKHMEENGRFVKKRINRLSAAQLRDRNISKGYIKGDDIGDARRATLDTERYEGLYETEGLSRFRGILPTSPEDDY